MTAKTVVIPAPLLAELLRAASAGYGAMKPEEERTIPTEIIMTITVGIMNHPEASVREYLTARLMGLMKKAEE